MLEVKIDLVPFGREEGRQTIAALFIWNVGRIEDDLCEYLASEVDPRNLKYAKNKPVMVRHHRSDGAWALVEAVREKMKTAGNRNDESALAESNQ